MNILPRYGAADNTNSTSATPPPWNGNRRPEAEWIRCGATGHRVRDCPFLPPQPPQPIASNVDITGALLEDDDELPKREIQHSLEKQSENASLL
jgi:hypothetical protein